MNCKPGDLALVACSPRPEYLGLPVEVIKLGKPMTFFEPYDRFSGTPIWLVRAPRKVMCNDRQLHDEFYMPDGALRPIRPDGITDEEVKELYRPSPIREVA